MFIKDILESCPNNQLINIVHFEGDTTSFECFLSMEAKDTKYLCELHVTFEGKDLIIRSNFDGVRHRCLQHFNDFIRCIESYYKSFDVSIKVRVKRKYDLKETILDVLFLK